jgi:hypothetical protein
VNRFVLHFGYPVITGVGNNGDEPRVSVFSNPVKEMLTVNATGMKEPGTISITDNLGRVLYNRLFDPASGNLNINIDVSEYAAGMYVLNFETENGNRVVKFVKN